MIHFSCLCFVISGFHFNFEHCHPIIISQTPVTDSQKQYRWNIITTTNHNRFFFSVWKSRCEPCQSITVQTANVDGRGAAVVSQWALSSARQTCRCTCWFPGLLANLWLQWNPARLKLALSQRKTWLTTPDTIAKSRGSWEEDQPCVEMRKNRWLIMRREREEEEEKEQFTELLGT